MQLRAIFWKLRNGLQSALVNIISNQIHRDMLISVFLNLNLHESFGEMSFQDYFCLNEEVLDILNHEFILFWMKTFEEHRFQLHLERLDLLEKMQRLQDLFRLRRWVSLQLIILVEWLLLGFVEGRYYVLDHHISSSLNFIGFFPSYQKGVQLFNLTWPALAEIGSS